MIDPVEELIPNVNKFPLCSEMHELYIYLSYINKYIYLDKELAS